LPWNCIGLIGGSNYGRKFDAIVPWRCKHFGSLRPRRVSIGHDGAALSSSTDRTRRACPKGSTLKDAPDLACQSIRIAGRGPRRRNADCHIDPRPRDNGPPPLSRGFCANARRIQILQLCGNIVNALCYESIASPRQRRAHVRISGLRIINLAGWTDRSIAIVFGKAYHLWQAFLQQPATWWQRVTC
jgi:hypothetical protein